MINLAPEECCGCEACKAACPVNAIDMAKDRTGAIYPKVDTGKCVHCSLCDKSCPEINQIQLNVPEQVLAMVYKNEYQWLNSTSGGIATAVATSFVKNGGVVYGCNLNSLEDIKHIRIDSIADVTKIQGSKYVHGSTYQIFSRVRDDLKNGLKVLFTGTPCQVGAIKQFLRKNYPNLYTIDIVCHGIPSQEVLRNAIKESFFKGAKENLKEYSVQFRWKSQKPDGEYFSHYGLKLIRKNDDVVQIEPPHKSAYITAFHKGYIFREHCHRCKYAGSERIGDMTLGDFWGLGKDIPSDLNPQSGVSLVLVNSQRGNSLLETIKDQCVVEERTLAEAKKENHSLNHPFPRPVNKDKFWTIYQKKGLRKALNACDEQFKSINSKKQIMKFAIYSLLLNSPLLLNLRKKLLKH